MLTSAREPALSLASRAARRGVLLVLSNVRRGQLIIHDHTTSQIHQFPSLPLTDNGQQKDDLKAKIAVVKDVFWLRVATMSDLGFAEAYMFGDIVCSPDDLLALFRVRFLFLSFCY